MAACETCWTEANWRARIRGGTTVEHYQALMAEHPDGHDNPADRTDPTVTAAGGEGAS